MYELSHSKFCIHCCMREIADKHADPDVSMDSGSCDLCAYREEREKLNMWVAYLNLENTYGQPPDEAVMKLFQRALQHVDQKKLYLALLAILESSKKVRPPTT